MKILRFHIILLAFIVCNKAGISQSSGSETLDDYLVIAAKNNPEVNAHFMRYLAALEKVPQVGALSDPQLTIGVFIEPMELIDGNQLADINLMQMFPWFGTLKAAKDEASMMAKASYEVFNESKADLYFRVRSSWYSIYTLERQIKLQQENIELLETLEQIALIRFQSPTGNNGTKEMPGSGGAAQGSADNGNNGMGGMGGMSGQSDTENNAQSGGSMPSGTSGMGVDKSELTDVLLAKMEILEQKNQLALLVDQKRTEEANFNSLLNRDQNLNVNIPDTLELNELSVEQLTIIDVVITNNPMLAMLDAESQSYLLMEKKARKMGLPMFGIGVDYMLIQKHDNSMSSMGGKDMVMPMLSVTLPIYRNKYKSMRNEAKLLYQATELEKEDMKNMLQVQSRQVIADLNEALRRTDLYNELLSLSRQTTDLLMVSYTSGETGFEEVLRSQYKVLDYGFNYFEAVTDYNTAVARAEKLMNSVNY